MTAPSKLQALRDLLAKGTKSPWSEDDVWSGDENGPHTVADAALIVAMRNSYEALLDVASAAEEMYFENRPAEYVVNPWQVDKLRAALARLGSNDD